MSRPNYIEVLVDSTKPLRPGSRRWAVYQEVKSKFEEAGYDPVRVLREPPPVWRGRRQAPIVRPEDWDPGLQTFGLTLGGYGAGASVPAGTVAGLLTADDIEFDKLIGSSAGGVALIPLLAKIKNGWSAETAVDFARTMNAGAPTHDFKHKIPDLNWTANIDLLGNQELSELGRWLDLWTAAAGIRTFVDLKYPPGFNRPLSGHRRDTDGKWRVRAPDDYMMSVGITVIDVPGDYSHLTQRQIDDPRALHAILRNAFVPFNYPLAQARQRFFPNDAAEEFPWLDPETEKLSDWIEYSCAQLPVIGPKGFLNPHTGALKIVLDGATLDTHPDLWQSGQLPLRERGDFLRTVVLRSRGTNTERGRRRQDGIDTGMRPTAINCRLLSADRKPLDLDISPDEHDAEFLAGFAMAGDVLSRMRSEKELDRWYHRILDADDTGKLDTHRTLHLWRSLLGDRNTEPTNGSIQLGRWN